MGSLWLYHLVDVVTWDVGSRAESENISGSAVVLESSPQLSKALVVDSMTSDRLVLGSVILMERLFLELATCAARLAWLGLRIPLLLASNIEWRIREVEM